MSVAARLGAFYFTFFCHAGAFVSYFSLYLAALGLSAGEIAFALAMPQLARLVAPTLWGWLADTLGARRAGVRRAIVVFSACALFGGMVSLYFAERPGSVALALLAMSLASAGALPLVEAITFAAVEGSAGRYGPIRLWGSVGFILAVLGTGMWLDYHQPLTLLHILLALTGAACAVALLLPSDPAHPPQPARARLGEVLFRPEVLAFFGACICMTAAHGALYVFYSIYLESAGYSKTVIGLMWTIGVLAEIVLFLRLPQLLAHFSLRALLLASFALAVARFLAIGFGVESLAVLALAQLAHAATFGAFHAASVAAVHRLFPGPLAGRGQALFSTLAYGAGGAIGSLVAGATWEPLGAQWSFAVSALFAALGGAFVLSSRLR